MEQAPEAVKEEQRAKRRAAAESLPEPSASSGPGKSRGPYKKKKPKAEIDPEYLKVLRDAYRKMVSVIRKLRDKDLSREEKLEATTEYLIDAGELLLVKRAAFFAEYAEEVNFGVACATWAGYRAVDKWKQSREKIEETKGTVSDALKAFGSMFNPPVVDAETPPKEGAKRGD